MSTRRKDARIEGDGRAGFTLIELLVAFTIAALVMGTVGAAMVRRDPRPSPLQVGQAMQSMMLRARSDAIVKGTDTMFAIDTRARRYAYPVGADPVALPEGQEIRMIAGGEFVSEDGATYFLLFRADGSSSGAEILLTDGRSADARIDVNWLTGVSRLIGEPGR